MRQLSGLSYANTGSLAYPLRTRSKEVVNTEVACAILDLIHPGNLGVLPPSPSMLAYKGEQIGVIKYGEMFRTVWF
jgi:hypothetical protein